LKIALVGCGKIADGHIEEIRKMPEKAHVVGVCDRELLMAEQVAKRYGIPRHYDRYDQMLQVEKPDVVHITTPPHSHLALAKQAIAAGCHVYVEKPLTLCSSDSREAIAAAEAAGRKLTIGYTYLFDPPALRMREMIAQGLVGDPIHIESFYGYNLSGPFGAALMGDSAHWVHQLPGKLFHNNIDHVLNRLTEFIPDDAPRIQASAFTRREQRFGDARDEMPDELRVLIQGSQVSAYATFASNVRPVSSFLRVYGTRGILHADFTGRTVTLEPAPKLPGAIGRLLPAFQQSFQLFRQGCGNVKRFHRYDFHFFAGLHYLISRYYDSILNDTDVPIPYRDMLWVSATMDEIFRQTRPEALRSETRISDIVGSNCLDAVLS
jgi:predicted dehydrogenase